VEWVAGFGGIRTGRAQPASEGVPQVMDTLEHGLIDLKKSRVCFAYPSVLF
jgi:hypothetical protein